MKINYNVLYANILFAILLVYSFGSSTTPDKIGASELLIGLLLCTVALGTPILNILALKSIGAGAYKKTIPPYLYVAIVYLLSVPVMVAALRGYTLNDIIRDYIPLLFLFLPVFLIPHVKQYDVWLIRVLGGLSVVGVVFSFRHFFFSEKLIVEIGRANFADSILLPQDPGVQFSLFFLALLVIKLVESKKYFFAALVMSFLTLPFLAELSILARAPLGLVIVMVIITFVNKLIVKRDLKLLLFMFMLFVGVSLFEGSTAISVIQTGFDRVLQKQEERGDNSARKLELNAVVDKTTSSAPQLLFGEGWGGVFVNPVHGRTVRYVHNFFGYFFLKTGSIGLLMVCVYMFWFFHMLFSVFKEQTSWYIALPVLGVLIIDLFFEVSYKGLTFGVVMFLIYLLHAKYVEVKNVV